MSTETQPSEFAVHTEKLDEASLVVLSGELDIAEAPRLILELRRVMTQHTGPVVFDVRKLTYIDSSGLSVVATTAVKLREQKRGVAAVGCHGILEKTLQITHLNRELECFPTIEEALEATRSEPNT